MIIELENGTELEVQDSATPDQVDEVVNHFYVAGQKVGGKRVLSPNSPGVSYGPADGGGGMDYHFPKDAVLVVPSVDADKPPQPTPIKNVDPPHEQTPMEGLKDAVGVVTGVPAAYIQGRTMGFGPKIAAGVGSTIAYPIVAAAKTINGENPPEFSELYKRGVEMYSAPSQQLAKDHPVLSFGAELAGGAKTLGRLSELGPFAKLGAVSRDISNPIGRVAARVAKNTAAGTALWSTYKAGTSKPGDEGSAAVEGAKEAIVPSLAVAAGGEVLGGLNYALGKKSPVPNADDLRKKAGEMYKLAEQKGGTLKPELTNQFVDEIEKLKPQTEVGKIVGGDSPFTKMLEKITGTVDENGNAVGGIRNKPISLEAAQEVDEALADAIDGFIVNGKPNKQGKKLLDIQGKFREIIEAATPEQIEGGKEGFDALKKGRKLWAQSRKLADIERIIQRAEMMDNPATGIKTGFRTLSTNPSRLRGYSKAEQAAIRKAAQTGIASDLLRTFGSRLTGIIGIASGAGPIGTAALTAASTGMRKAATEVQLSKASKLSDLVANGSPVKKTPLVQIGRQKTPAVVNPLLSIGQQ